MSAPVDVLLERGADWDACAQECLAGNQQHGSLRRAFAMIHGTNRVTINTNIAALNGAHNLNQATQRLNASLARLSSGSKLVTPADDPAGLAESVLLTAAVAQTGASSALVANATSFAQTQDGYLQQIGTALDKMSQLAVSAQDVTLSTAERAGYQAEFSNLAQYITDAQSKNFNGVSLFSAAGLTIAEGDGTSFQAGGVTASYFGPTTTTTTSTVADAATTTLSSLAPSYAGGILDDFATSGHSFNLNPTDTISDMVSAFNGTGGDTNASYNASTGVLSITVNSGVYFDDRGGPSSPTNFLAALGFSIPQNPTFPGSENTHIDNTHGGPPVTVTTTLTHSSTTTTTNPAGTLDISSTSNAATSAATLSSAVTQLASDRATIGANLQRLNYLSQGLSSLQTNLQAANSQITDVDVATESTAYAREQILTQFNTSILAQANSAPQSVLKLLQ